VPKPKGSALTENGQDSWSPSTPSRSFTKGKCLRSCNTITNTTPTIHPHPHPLSHIQIPHPQYPPSPMYETNPQALLQYPTIDLISPLADHLQLAPWPPQYRAALWPKHHGDTKPHKFLMCYEATITSASGDEVTLAKSLIISQENATTNWYSRLPPKRIYPWQQLKEKILLSCQGFQAKLSTEEVFMSYA
jgi:hypothetical protein